MFGFNDIDLGLVVDIAFWLVTDDADTDPGTLVVLNVAFCRPVTVVEVVSVDGTAGLVGLVGSAGDKMLVFVVFSKFIVAVVAVVAVVLVVEAICEVVSFIVLCGVRSPQAFHVKKVALVSIIVFWYIKDLRKNESLQIVHPIVKVATTMAMVSKAIHQHCLCIKNRLQSVVQKSCKWDSHNLHMMKVRCFDM